MLRRVAVLLMPVMLVLSLASCQPLSQHPLVDPNQAEKDTRLYGVWISVPEKGDENRGFSVLQIGPAVRPLTVGAKEPEKGLVQAWFTQHNQKDYNVGEPLGLFFVSAPVGNTWVASLSEGVDRSLAASEADKSSSLRRITDTDKRFWFLRYQVSDDTLSIWGTPNLQVLDQAIAAGKLQGTVERNDKREITAVSLTDSTDTLKEYFDANWQQLFPGDPAIAYKRVAVPEAQ